MKRFLETPRLYFRRFTANDDRLLYDLDRDPDVMRYINGGAPTPLEDIQNELLPRILRFYERYDTFGFWAVHTIHDNAFIGWFHFQPVDGNPSTVDLGYRLKKDAWGRGYATEGSLALIDRGFRQWNVDTVLAHAMRENRASIHVMEKIGMKFERRFLHDVGVEVVQYKLDRQKYLSKLQTE